MNRERLAAVLRVRTVQERSARGELARRNRQHHQAASVEERTWAMLDRRSAHSHGSITSNGLAAAHAIVRAGVLAAETQRVATDLARDRVVVAHGEWSTAARRVEALERLAERQAEAEAIEAERKQHNEVDDLVLARRGHERSAANATGASTW